MSVDADMELIFVALAGVDDESFQKEVVRREVLRSLESRCQELENTVADLEALIDAKRSNIDAWKSDSMMVRQAVRAMAHYVDSLPSND